MLNKIQVWLAGLGVVLMALMAVFFRGRAQGKQEVQHEQLELALDAVKNARKIERDNATVTDGDVDKRLSKYFRD